MAGTLSHVTLYTRQGCHLCEAVEEVLRRVQNDRPFELNIIDIDRDDEGRALYSNDIPVVLIDGREVARHRLDRGVFERALDSSQLKLK